MAEKYYELTEVENTNGRLFVYKRTADAVVWTFRANVDGYRGYIRRSTKQADLNEAKREATRAFNKLEERLEQNLTIKKTRFDEVFATWLKVAKRQKAEQRYKYVVSTYERYLVGHFGKLDLSAIKQKQIDAYWDYRASFYVGGEGVGRAEGNLKRLTAKSKTSRNIKVKPSYGTLRAEASIVNEFLTWALRNEHVGREFRLRASDAGYTKQERRTSRRETFDRDEWNSLTSYLRHYRDGTGSFKDDRLNKGHKTQRNMFWCYVLFLGSTGLRTGEAKQVRWGDITHSYDKKQKKWITQVSVREETTKVREARTAIAHSEKCKEWLDYWRERSEHNNDNDLVFYGTKDVNVGNDFSVTFRTFLKRCSYKDRQEGLLKHTNGKARTLYSLRHLYATFRITVGGVEIYTLAKSMGTSVKQIEQHYGHLADEHLIVEMTKNKNEGALAGREEDLKTAAEMIGLLRDGKIDAEQVTKELVRIAKT